jgi:hypothetical protein
MFKQYPKTQYDLYSDGSTFTLTDITRGVVVDRSRLPDDSLLYTYYQLNNGDRPDVVSHKLYGDVQYYWTFFITNEFLRGGLAAWQLSSTDFNKMIATQYGKYSALTSSINTFNNLNDSGLCDLSLIPLSEEYLPHIRLSDESGGRASIVKYDGARHQLVIEDIHRVQGDTRIEISRGSFLDASDRFQIIWVGGPETDALKDEWVNTIYENIIQYDADGLALSLQIGQTKEQYVFGKYIAFNPNKNYRWTEYFNAAHEYYSPDGSVVSAYETLSDSNVVSPTYKSFYVLESEINDDKRALKVIRPDYIREFSTQYYRTLLGEA